MPLKGGKYNEHGGDLDLIDLSKRVEEIPNLFCNSLGTYIFVIEGKISVAEEVLHKRDGMGVEGVDQLVCQGIETSDVLLIEVPM